MFKHLLIPTDGSELSEHATRAGLAFAKALGARVTGFCAIEQSKWSELGYLPFDTLSPGQRKEQEQQWVKHNLDAFGALAKEAGVPCEVTSQSSHSAYEGILAAAKEKGCDLIFMASHGRRGVEGLLLGSQTMKVLTHSSIPVLVYRESEK